jgi:16S rRNA (guanine1207-N2)-methyltransferase
MPSAFLDLLAAARSRVRPPVLIPLGAPRLVADFVVALGLPEISCYQMDLHQAGRLCDELREFGADASVGVKPDLWDLPAEFNTVLYPSPPRGERELKRDVVEQAFHVLRPRGLLVVLSPVKKDQFFPAVMKKSFGKVALETTPSGTVLWSPRSDDRARRRHELTFRARPPNSEKSLTLVSRPGVFSYGRLDDGARAVAEVAEILPGERVVDLGCGSGAVGVFAGLRGGSVTFVDSNVRAAALAELNARNNGLTDFRVVADAQLHRLPDSSFDVALANPPYYAQQGVARLFIDGAGRLLRPGRRLYLVTKQPHVIGEMMRGAFGEPTLVKRRDYTVFIATKR